MRVLQLNKGFSFTTNIARHCISLNTKIKILKQTVYSCLLAETWLVLHCTLMNMYITWCLNHTYGNSRDVSTKTRTKECTSTIECVEKIREHRGIRRSWVSFLITLLLLSLSDVIDWIRVAQKAYLLYSAESAVSGHRTRSLVARAWREFQREDGC